MLGDAKPEEITFARMKEVMRKMFWDGDPKPRSEFHEAGQAAHRFIVLCSGVFGDACADECIALSALYEAADNVGVEAMAGRADGATAPWARPGYFPPKRAIVNGDPSGQTIDELGDSRGALVGGPPPIPQRGWGHNLRYRFDANDCFACLTEGACTPSCILSGSCMDADVYRNAPKGSATTTKTVEGAEDPRSRWPHTTRTEGIGTMEDWANP
jgi:hypothetical protein